MNIRRTAPALVLVGACALAAAGTAAAGAPPKAPREAVPVSIAAPGKALPAATVGGAPRILKGYSVVSSGPLSAPAESQTRGRVSCPFPLVVLGGGVFVQSTSTLVSVNSSFPATSTPGWIADVNNASGLDTTFSVSAICAQQPRHYSIVFGNAVDNPSGSQVVAQARCPTGSQPLSGGPFSSSFQLFTNVNTTINSQHGWTVVENNASAEDDSVTADVICAKINGYLAVPGQTVVNPAGSQTFSTSSCPAPSVVVGGGTASNAPSVGVNVNSSIIDANGWDSYENNASGVDFQELTTAICVGAVA
jgi:hypothetical protein